MNITDTFRANLETVLSLPNGTYVGDVIARGDGTILIETQHWHLVRPAFAGVIWKKNYNEACKWWDYTAEIKPGVFLRCYGDYEGPQSCRKESYEVEEDVQVPVKFKTERKIVTKTRWVCPEPEHQEVTK